MCCRFLTLLIVAGFYNILNMLIYEKMNDIAYSKAMAGKDVQMIFISAQDHWVGWRILVYLDI